MQELSNTSLNHLLNHELLSIFKSDTELVYVLNEVSEVAKHRPCQQMTLEISTHVKGTNISESVEINAVVTESGIVHTHINNGGSVLAVIAFLSITYAPISTYKRFMILTLDDHVCGFLWSGNVTITHILY